LIIGFNDHCAFGFTNAMRDVRDYYEIKFRDDSRKEYWFENEWKAATFRKEILKIKGQSDLIDSVAYTHFGPVMYDKDFTGGRTPGDKYYAVRWKAHDPSNELKTFLLLEKAETYEDYLEAIKNMHTPGQNCIFANKQGDIAIWDQGEFPAKWKRQGDFVMPGTDSSYRWKGNIPQEENPHLLNPERGFVSSANQLPADSAYPYYLGGNFPPYRAMEINRRLDSMSNITPEDMMKLQTDNYNLFAETAMPLLLKNIDESALNADQKNYLQTLKQWNFRNEINSKAATMFVLVWDSLENKIWNDEFNQTGLQLMRPYESTLLNNLLKDSAFSFIDDINTPQIETLQHEVTNIFKNLTSKFKKLQDANRLEWGNYKDTRILHLSRLEPLSRLHLPIGGGTNCINATKTQHGPSWRMIVSLTSETEAWATYPGGQDGNPGSRYYDDNVNAWAKGEYNKLWIMKDSDKTDNRVKGMITFSKEN
jgi:penicillin amidase